MVNHFEMYFVACCAYFTAKLQIFFYTPILKTLGQFENLVFVIMSTRENIRLIARSSFKCTMCTCCGKLAGLFSHVLLDIERELFLLQ